ncbi:MAG: cyclic nucleotide-binding protein [Treponema sp.]|nr:MAG: cyclic nucleotide-binding protein [Treponema sp.]
MKRIPIITTVETTANAILEALDPNDVDMSAFKVKRFEDAVSVLKYELPEIKIIDFGDPNIDAEGCMSIIKADPWLLFGGVIAIVEKNSNKIEIEQRKDPNFLFVTSRREFEEHASQIIRILKNHQHFLFNRRSHIDLDAVEHGHFVSETDPFEIVFYANLLGTYLYNTNRINDFERASFQGSMMELLLNAVEHGNCGITYDEKTQWLEAGKNILDLIDEKRKTPEVKNKRVYITYQITPEKTGVTIRDEGKGFDWKKRLNAEFQAGLHGMGIKMSQNMVKELTYNDIGNAVYFEILNQKNTANLTPAILRSQQVLSFRHMQIVCKENEESNDIFYICSGKYAVYVDNKLLTVMTPADIFIGEMAFLLNDKRSATIVAIGEGTLIRMDKMKFMRLMEQYPHYGIFLAKLVAQRLVVQSRQSARLRSEVDKLEEQIID